MAVAGKDDYSPATDFPHLFEEFPAFVKVSEPCVPTVYTPIFSKGDAAGDYFPLAALRQPAQEICLLTCAKHGFFRAVREVDGRAVGACVKHEEASRGTIVEGVVGVTSRTDRRGVDRMLIDVEGVYRRGVNARSV